ncbi:MAG: cell surface protein, partial [Lapillicoccus sp.]
MSDGSPMPVTLLHRPTRRWRRWVAAATGAVGTVVLSSGLVALAPPALADTAPPAGLAATVSADPLPTTQIDGVAWTQTVIGPTVYVGGSFTNARPAGAAPGTNQTPRTNLLAYTLSTGVLVGSWAPSANAPVLSLASSPDGSRLYVAGQFTQVAGQPRNRVAAFSTATGQLLSTWAPDVNGKVNSVVATSSTVYLGGEFTSVNGAGRTKVAAVSAANGSTLPFNAVLAGGYGVRSVVVSPDASKVVIGGSFTSTNGSTNPGRGMAALDASTGASLPWAVNSLIRDAGTNAAMYSLASDGDSVYGTGYDYYGTAEDGFEGSFRARWSDGVLVWMEDCHGDTYSVFPTTDAVYVTGHSHYCGNVQGFPQTSPNWQFHHSLAFSKAPSGNVITADPLGYKSYAGQPDPTLLAWFPEWVEGTYTGQSQAGWDVKASGDYVLYGGEFPAVEHVAQQGLVRFAKSNIAPNKVGPQTQGGSWTLSTRSLRAGEVRLSWQANYDPDNTLLHYQVFRQDKGTTTPLWEGDLRSTFWNLPLMTYADTSVTAGNSYSYRVKATDPFGNWTWTDWTPVTATSAVVSPYVNAVFNDNAQSYWRLGE